jgi:hypothetical protein
MTTNDNTPEKSTTEDTCPFCGSYAKPVIYCKTYACGYDTARFDETDGRTLLCRALEAKNKAEAP